jgi:hypothetical protein
LPGDDSVRKIVRKPEGCSRHFKRDIENPVGLRDQQHRSQDWQHPKHDKAETVHCNINAPNANELTYSFNSEEMLG